jgi:hypothetical protein
MEQPRKNEHWHVNNTSLTGKDNNSIVKVLEDKTLTVPNWRKHKYKCDRKGEEVWINGDYFVEKFAEASETLRVFSNPSRPA